MTHRRGPALRRAALAFSLLIFAACSAKTGEGSPSPTPVIDFSFEGKGSALSTMARLCDVHEPSTSGGPEATGETPPAIQEVEHEVSSVRGLEYLEPVPVESVSAAEMASRVKAQVIDGLKGDSVDRRGRAWETIGVIPEGTDLRSVYEKLYTGTVIGYYDPGSGQLVFIGSESLTPVEKLTLAHELTHALDDQHFDLTRLDAIGKTCHDEAYEAGLAAVEGSAQLGAIEVGMRYLTPNEKMGLVGSLGEGADAIPEGTPPFVLQEEIFPYEAGSSFMSARSTDQGNEGVDQALRHLPATTSEILHPETYGQSEPPTVDIPDLAASVPGDWQDLDVMQIGEAWLSRMIDLRAPGTVAAEAAAGVEAGIYRAWSKGDATAVAMSTVWTSGAEAARFADVLREWGAGQAIAVSVHGDRVEALFASDDATLKAFVGAATPSTTTPSAPPVD